MCGIIGIASNEKVVDKLLTGLTRQEYRGYDSAGHDEIGYETNEDK